MRKALLIAGQRRTAMGQRCPLSVRRRTIAGRRILNAVRRLPRIRMRLLITGRRGPLEGQRVLTMRKAIVIMGARRPLVRVGFFAEKERSNGLANVRDESHLMALTHNVLKLTAWGARGERPRSPRTQTNHDGLLVS